MNKDNDLMDSLLKEHAKSKGVDEEFLSELESKLDAECAGSVISMEGSADRSSPRSSKMGLGLGVGVAACAALYVGGSMLWQKSNRSEAIAVNSGAADMQIERAKEEMQSSRDPRSTARVTDDAVIEQVNDVGDSDVMDMGLRVGVKKNESEARSKKKKSPLPKLALEAERGGNIAGMPAPGSTGRDGKPTREEMVQALDDGRAGVGYSSKSKVASKGGTKRWTDVDRARGATGFLTSDFIELDASENFTSEVCRSDKMMKSFGSSNFERYGQLIENEFTTPADKESKRSTFAIDVDTASYANVRRLINSGSEVPADSVRIEEMINYFDYQYKGPTQDMKHPFAVHVDAAICPWNENNRLVRIALQGKEIIREGRPASNVCFLLDVSGSMNRANKLPLLKENLKYLLEEMNEKDTISIVVYAGASGLVLPATKVDDAGRVKILKAMERLVAGGSTVGGAGIKLAYKLAQENFIKDGVNRVILATDGDFNVGVTDSGVLKEIVKREAEGGVEISVMGFGAGNLNDNMLELIVNNGNGRYSYIDTIKEGRKVLLEDMMGAMVTIAKDVKIQLEFNPAKVKEYRLIGYSSRMLPDSAFLDKKADAREIGAGHRVTAFYEIVPGKALDKSKMDDLRYSKKTLEEVGADEGAGHFDELLNVKLAYKQPDQKVNDESTYLSVPLQDDVIPWGQVDDDFKFGSSVALFGMVLRNSEHWGAGNLELALNLAEAGKGADGKGLREEFINLIKKLKDVKN